MLTESGLLTENFQGRTLHLKYDFKMLLRWLLKVSFNSSRTDGAHSHLFEPYIPFILGESEAPKRYQVASIAYLAAPEIRGHSRLKDEAFNGQISLNPFLARICYGAVRGGSGYTLRLTIFGPLVIYLLMFHEEVTPGHAAVEIRRITKLFQNTVELKNEKKFAELSYGQKTWLDLYEHQTQRVRALKSDG